MIIDNTYFEKDPIYISGIANRKDDKPTALAQTLIDSANSYIAIYEPIFLRNLLGEALAATAEENPQIVALLRNEATKTSPLRTMSISTGCARILRSAHRPARRCSVGNIRTKRVRASAP